ncbi:MAG: hypothetical protein WDA08_09420 [Weeksellaceae bacterium]
MKKSIFLLLSIAGIVNAQTVQDISSVSVFSNDVNAGSARYIGMGGSMGALGSELSSSSQNPAGGALAITSEFGATLAFNTFNNKTTFGSTVKTNDNSFDFQNLTANMIFENNLGAWNRFSIGISFAKESMDNWLAMDRNNQITETFQPGETLDGTTTYTMNGYQDLMIGYKSKMSVDFGASYQEKLYLGLGLNIHDTQYDNYVFFDEDTNGTVYRYDLNGTPYSVKATGYSLSAGAIARVNDQFRFGLAYHSPVWYDNLEENFYANLPVGEDEYQYDFYYSNYDRISNSRLVASAGAILMNSLALNVDYTLHMNGSTQFKPNGDFTQINNFLDQHLKSSSEIRVGGEYIINDFSIRAGYNYVQSPFESITLNADAGNGIPTSQNFSKAIRGDLNRISFGVGYDFGGFRLDAAYQMQNQKYNYVFGNADYVDFDSADNTVYYATLPLNADHNYVADVKNTRNMFLLSAAWQF